MFRDTWDSGKIVSQLTSTDPAETSKQVSIIDKLCAVLVMNRVSIIIHNLFSVGSTQCCPGRCLLAPAPKVDSALSRMRHAP
jgi:hypothetical protein